MIQEGYEELYFHLLNNHDIETTKEELDEIIRIALRFVTTYYKESSILKREANMTDSDIIAFGKYCASMRMKRKERFEDKYLNKIDQITKVTKRDNGSYSFTYGIYGTIDYFPKANKLLIRKDNKWIKPGLRWLIKNIIK
jgi:hypothetical protein